MSDQRVEVSVQLRWGDMDINNHVNNVAFARLFEEARVRTFAQWFPQRPTRLSMVLARQDIEFWAVLNYTSEPVTVQVWVTRVGTSSFAMGLLMTTPDGTPCALAETTMVLVDPDAGGSAPIPDVLRETLDAHLGDPPPFHRR